jgi:hypothetical protein
MTDRRFPPPWTMERLPGGFKVIDATGGKLGSPSDGSLAWRLL